MGLPNIAPYVNVLRLSHAPQCNAAPENTRSAYVKALHRSCKLLLVAIAFAIPSAQAQLLNNGFNSGAANWTAGGLGTTATAAPNSGITLDSLSLSGNYYWLDGPAGAVPGLQQTFTAPGGSVARVAGNYGTRVTGAGTSSFVLQILNSGSTVLTQNTFDPTAAGVWSNFEASIAALPAGSYRMLLIGQANGFNDDYMIDNIHIAFGTGLENGDFEKGDVFWRAGGLGTSAALLAPNGRILNDGFSLSGNYYWLDGAFGAVPGLQQTFTTTAAGPLKLSGNYMSRLNAVGTNSFVVQILNNGNTVLQQDTFNPTALGAWRNFNVTTASLPAGTYKALFIGQANGFDSDFAIDNISITNNILCDGFETGIAAACR
jgi:hypothetical protein